MPIYRVQGPDGRIHRIEGPEGASPDAVMAAVRSNIGRDKSAARGFALGSVKPLDNAARAVSNIPVIGPALDRAGRALGMPTASQASDEHDTLRRNNTRTGFQAAGNIAGTLPALALPGGPAVQGAVSGGLLTDKKDAYGATGDMALGASLGVVGDRLMKGLGAAVSPALSKGARALHDMGVNFTPGQIGKMAGGVVGNIAQGAEAIAQRLPIAKNVVHSAQNRGQEAYYRGVLKRTGVEVPKNIELGHEAHSYIGRKLSGGYQALLPQLRVSADPKLVGGLAKTEAKLKTDLTPENFQLFKNALASVNLKRTKGFNIDGETFKKAETALGAKAEGYWKKYARSRDPQDRALAEGYSGILDQMRGMLMRQNPKHAPQLSQLNKQWRELALIRKAAGDESNASGVFTPAQYSRAAKGSRSNQEVSRTANQFLTNRVPDSGTTEGTAGAGLLALMGGSGGSAGAAGAAVGMSPVIGLPATLAPLLYTKQGAKALNKAVFAPRSKPAMVVGETLKRGAKVAPWIAPPLVTRPRD